jgi:8-oxo-dGTP diphosphatase
MGCHGNEDMMVEPDREFGEAVAGATYIRRPGGYAVISNTAGEVAVVSTRHGLYLPGGGQEAAETPEQAAIREAYEECGLLIRLRSYLGTADELAFAANEEAYYRKRCAFFSAEVVHQEGHSEADHDLIWMVPEEAAARLHHESQRWAVSEARRRGFVRDP